MSANEQLIERFYSAFRSLDAETMNACYCEDVLFSDPVFGELRGDEARAMWRMLAARAKNFELTFSNVQADDRQGSAHWEARYDFSATGRRVHNSIEARFVFRDGKIIEHRDTFDFWRWARQALGAPGALFGWLPQLRRKVSAEARRGLKTFMAKQTS